jgi:hypothetical protein
MAALAVITTGCGDSGPKVAAPSTQPSLPPTSAAPAGSSTSAATTNQTSSPATRGPVTITKNNLTVHAPTGWVAEGSLNYFGFGPVPRPPGTALVAIEALFGFTDSIDSLKPSACEAQTGNDRPTPTAVTVTETGFRPVGDRSAEYRNWSVSCPNGSSEGHRAWLLPQSRIALYERCRMDANTAVVTTAEVADTGQVTSSSVRPPKPESPFSCKN